MPHATDKLTNGEKSSSKFLSHATSYPIVNDTIETYKSNPYGKKSLEIVDGAYTRFGKPVEPYLETPYSYAKPYVQKADEIADSVLGKAESHFPIVKEDTQNIIDTTKSYAFWPYNYLSSTWQDEYSKTANHNNRGPGLVTAGMALISTELKIASDFFQTVADILGPKYEESKKKGADYVNDVKDKVDEYTKVGQEKAQEVQKVGEEKAGDAKKEAQKTKDEAQKKAQK